MFDNINSWDEVFQQSTDVPPTAPSRPLRRRKSWKKWFTFWICNLIIMPLVALLYATVGAHGLRALMPIFEMRLSKAPIPGFGLLARFEGWSRIDLSILMALILCVAVTFLWFRIFGELNDSQLVEQRHDKPLKFFLLATIAAIVIIGDSLIFFVGLSSQSSNGWDETPAYVPIVATIIYAAGLALIGAWHNDYHQEGCV